jgi:hypothetical protein
MKISLVLLMHANFKILKKIKKKKSPMYKIIPIYASDLVLVEASFLADCEHV